MSPAPPFQGQCRAGSCRGWSRAANSGFPLGRPSNFSLQPSMNGTSRDAPTTHQRCLFSSVPASSFNTQPPGTPPDRTPEGSGLRVRRGREARFMPRARQLAAAAWSADLKTPHHDHVRVDFTGVKTPNPRRIPSLQLDSPISELVLRGVDREVAGNPIAREAVRVLPLERSPVLDITPDAKIPVRTLRSIVGPGAGRCGKDRHDGRRHHQQGDALGRRGPKLATNVHLHSLSRHPVPLSAYQPSNRQQ